MRDIYYVCRRHGDLRIGAHVEVAEEYIVDGFPTPVCELAKTTDRHRMELVTKAESDRYMEDENAPAET